LHDSVSSWAQFTSAHATQIRNCRQDRHDSTLASVCKEQYQVENSPCHFDGHPTRIRFMDQSFLREGDPPRSHCIALRGRTRKSMPVCLRSVDNVCTLEMLALLLGPPSINISTQVPHYNGAQGSQLYSKCFSTRVLRLRMVAFHSAGFNRIGQSYRQVHYIPARNA